MRKLIAFTLAETLIVMGIIGIVSALTLPNLNSSTGEKEKIAKVKKIYRDLNDAYGRATAVYGPIGDWFINDNTDKAKTTRLGERISEFMKVSKTCGHNSGCYNNNQVRYLSDPSDYDPSSPLEDADYYYMFVLADGTSVALGYQLSNKIFVDIDGINKGKNTWGSDIFAFKFKDSYVEPYKQDDFSAYLACTKSTSSPCPESMTGWIIDYDNADYIELSQNNGKCKNGTTPTEQNPRCK